MGMVGAAIMTDFLVKGVGPAVEASLFPGALLVQWLPIPGRIPWTANRKALPPRCRIPRTDPR